MEDSIKMPEVNAYYDDDTNTISYLVVDPETKCCAVIDSVLNFDYAAGTIAYQQADQIIADITAGGLTLQWLIETHVHADHLSAAPYIQQKSGGDIIICKDITKVQDIFGKVFNAGTEFERDGSQFDRLLSDGDSYMIGNISARAIHTPGHTPACMAHVIGDAVFVGDTLFMPDGGTARADFPGGDARQLFRSIRRLMQLPDETRLFLCHDYKAAGRDRYVWETTVGAQRVGNVHVHEGVNEDDFVAMRTSRDATLAMPKLILPSVQVNMRGGHLPAPEANGTRYLKIPLDAL